MTILSLRPSEIHYSQDSIAYKFGYGPYSGTPIGQTLDDLLQGKCSVSDIPTITVSLRDGLWYSGDNRRLWVFRKCEELGIIDRVPAEEGYISSSKFTTYNKGVSIRIRGSPGGRLWTQRNRIELVLKDPEPPEPVGSSATVTNTSSDKRFMTQSSFLEEVKEEVSNNGPSYSSEDLTDIVNSTGRYDKPEPLQRRDSSEETGLCLQSYHSLEGQDNNTFVGDYIDQKCMSGIEDHGCLNEIMSQSTLNGFMVSDNGYMTVDLFTLEGGQIANGDSVVLDLQSTKSSVVDTIHSTVRRPMDAAEVEMRQKLKVSCMTAVSENIHNCLCTRAWVTFVIMLNILCLVLWVLRFIM